MSMRWPWQRAVSGAQLVFSWADGMFSYVLVKSQGARFTVKAAGIERLAGDSLQVFAARLAALGLQGVPAMAMLRPGQYQWLQIDAPKVPPEELRAAARYLAKDLLSAHIDDITLDVLRVGDDAHKAGEFLFVLAATNAQVRELLDLSDAMQWNLRVIDVQETAQRNLQNLEASLAQRGRDRADALLTLADDRQGLLTISANDELFFTRRLDLPAGFMTMDWQSAEAAAPAAQDYVPVTEYVPEYAVHGESYGTDYSNGTGDYAAKSGEAHQRVLLELQRSVDLWDRSWSAVPLQSVHVAAGARSAELAQWLTRDMGQSVQPLDVSATFVGWNDLPEGARMECWPLLGVLLRNETRSL